MAKIISTKTDGTKTTTVTDDADVVRHVENRPFDKNSNVAHTNTTDD